MSYILRVIKYIKEEKTSETQELRLKREITTGKRTKMQRWKNNRRMTQKNARNTKYTSYKDYIWNLWKHESMIWFDPQEKKCKKAKCLSEEALQIAVKRREAKRKGEKERYKHLNAEFQRIARRDKKDFLSD